MVLTIAEETALEEWFLVMYRWGSPIRLGMLKCMAAAILEDREWRNIKSAPGFFHQLMDSDPSNPTRPQSNSEWRLLILDGHDSHTTWQFIHFALGP